MNSPSRFSPLLALLALQLVGAEEFQYIKLQSLESDDGTYFCVGELELYDSYRQISLMEYEDCSAASTLAGFPCENAFQGNQDASKGYCSNPRSSLISAGTEKDGAVGSVLIYMRPGDDVTKFKITAMSTTGGGALAPTAFELYGSNGGGDWTLLYEDDGLSWDDGETKTFYTDGSCDARNRWGTGDEDFDETCAEKGYSACTGAFKTLCEWKEETYFETCLDILLDGTTKSGAYEIYVAETQEFIQVWCDMQIGGWTRVINVPSDEAQTAVFASGSDAIGNNLKTGSGELYKLSDDTINALMGDDPTIQYRCGSVDYFVYRESGWITAIDQTGWLVDRDMDGTPDCDASRSGYLFSDYNENDINPVDGASIEECGTAGHTDFGFYDGTELGCYNSEDDWGNRAHIYVRGKPANTRTINSCSDLERSDWTGIYLTDYGALYCNQDLEGGDITGGWTLLMKTTTSGNLLEYGADYWSTSNTLNGDSMFTYHINYLPQQAKLEPFNGDHAGYRIEFNEYLAYWPTFDTADVSTWYIGVFESMTALEFFQTPRTLSNDAMNSIGYDADYFSADEYWGKSGICYSGSDLETGVRWGYVFASADFGADVMALGGIGLDTLGGEFTTGISSGDVTLEDVVLPATYSGEGVQTSYPVEVYGRVYLGATYSVCSKLPPDADTGMFYTPEVVPMFCNNELEGGGWTMVFKTIGDNTEITYTSDYIDSDVPMTKDPAVDSVNMNVEDAQLWTYSTYEMDQFLFVWPDSDAHFVTGHLATPMTTQDYLATYDTYRDDAPITIEPTFVFGRRYFDGGVCTRADILDCTTKYFADGAVDNILTYSPAPSPSNEPTFTANAYTAVGASCDTFNVLSQDTDGGYVDQGSIGASISYCGALCDLDEECAGFQLSTTACTLVGDTSNAKASSNGNDNLAITGGNICYAQVPALYTTAPPPMWEELPNTVYLGDTFNGWGKWDDDASEDYQYCADSVVASSCDPMDLDECLALCEAEDGVEFCSYGAYASEGFTENSADGLPGGSECCIGTATCSTLTTSQEDQDARYIIYQRLHQQTSEYRACNVSTDCNEAYYCAAYLMQADPGSATAEIFLGTNIANTKVMCMPCVDATGVTCAEWGDAIDSCDSCADFAVPSDMPIIQRECGLDQYVDQATGECAACTTSCDPGFYLKGDRCTGVETEDGLACEACTSSCGLGQYMVGQCSGTSYTNDVTCANCVTECDEGYFVDASQVTESVYCIGKGYQSPVCTPCTSRCNAGFFLDGTCDGTGDENEVTCVECANECEAGQYVESQCSGLGTSDDTTCVDCRSECNTDEYLVGTCDGTGSHDSVYCQKCQMFCVEGQYFSERCDGTTDEDPLTCFDCTASCDDGFFMQGICDGLGDSDNVECISCDSCEPGVLQSDGFNCEATCLGSIIAAVPDADGDQTNVVLAPFAFIGAGILNTAEGVYSVVSSGIYNVASGYGSIIGGGAYNVVGAAGDYSVIGGGESNSILGTYNIIAGGTNNKLGEGTQYNVIGGGLDNLVEGGNYNAVLGGDSNIISGSTSQKNLIAGGQYNTISGKWSSILGGKNNAVNGNYNLIAGGANNKIIDSNFAAISGGQKNTVEGKNSIAIGSKAETRAAYSATFGFQQGVCETRAERVVNFCADEVAINGRAVLTLFVSRRRQLAQEEEESLKSVSEVIFSQEAELAALDAEIDEMLNEIEALTATTLTLQQS